jgi:hypothetical protein
MTDSFGVDIVGDTRAVLRFERFPAAAHDRLLATLKSLEKRLEAAVLAEEPEKSGKLKSLTGGRVYDHGDRIAAVVGVRVTNANQARKAAALEYGSRGTSITVSAHTAKLDHLWSRAISPISVNVPSFNRTPTITAKRFLRGPIQVLHDEAIAEMRAALDAAVADAAT